MSSKHKAQLRKARAKLSEANDLIRMYKSRVAGDADALVNYVQGIAEFGQYAIDALVDKGPDRVTLLYASLVSYAQAKGMIYWDEADKKWVVTHLCNKEPSNGPAPTE